MEIPNTSNVSLPLSLPYGAKEILVPSSKSSRIAWVEQAGIHHRTTLIIRHASGAPFRILRADSSSSHIWVHASVKDSAAEHVVDITLTADTPPGIHRETVVLTLDIPEQSELILRVFASLHGLDGHVPRADAFLTWRSPNAI